MDAAAGQDDALVGEENPRSNHIEAETSPAQQRRPSPQPKECARPSTHLLEIIGSSKANPRNEMKQKASSQASSKGNDRSRKQTENKLNFDLYDTVIQ